MVGILIRCEGVGACEKKAGADSIIEGIGAIIGHASPFIDDHDGLLWIQYMELGIFAADGRRLLFLFLVRIYGLLYLPEKIWQGRATERLSRESLYPDLSLVLGSDHYIFDLGVSVPLVCHGCGAGSCCYFDLNFFSAES